MKYLLLEHYRGAPEALNAVPMDRWTPEEVEDHVQFMTVFAARLESTGEFVDSQALSPEDGRALPGDQGPDRRLDGDRRRHLRARDGARRRAVGSARCRRQADPRVARAVPVPECTADGHRLSGPVNDLLLRELTPAVIGRRHFSRPR
jgi:hypothetical protein